MGRNEVYWQRQIEYTQKAKKHKEECESNYSKEIEECVQKTSIYSDKDYTFCVNEKVHVPKIELVDSTSVEAIWGNKDNGKLCVLNFADYRYPGGMFAKGSIAQEESLCHQSILFNVLRAFDEDYYSWNRTNLNLGMHLNRALYSRDIPFFKHQDDARLISDGNEAIPCDVITCAAPNWSVGYRWERFTKEENHDALMSRINFIIEMAGANKVDTLILGAFGCGVFMNDSKATAECFKDAIHLYGKHFKKVVFAIPDKDGKAFKDFKNVFEDMLRHK